MKRSANLGDVLVRAIAKAAAQVGLTVTNAHGRPVPRKRWQFLSPRNHPAYPRWRDVLPLPTPELMITTGPLTGEAFYVIGEAWSQRLVASAKRHLPMHVRQVAEESRITVLDIGCGCGKTARHLINLDNIHYVGFDILRPCIDWCKAAFAPYGDRFRFEHFDGYSEIYNPAGTIRATEYVFPCADASIDCVIGASLFTHLLEPDARHYLAEIRRVLRNGGLALLSIHTEPTPGAKWSGTERRIDVATDYFIELARNVDLVPLEQDVLCGQLAILFKKSACDPIDLTPGSRG